MNLIGKLHKIMDVSQVTATFKKRDFVVEFADNPMYPQYILMQLVQDRTNLLEGFNEGDTVEIQFNLRGRAWNSPSGETKYFNSIEAWQIKPVAQAADAKPEPVGVGASASAVDVTQMGDDDDLPF